MVIELKERAPRVRFKHPVRVVPLDGSPRIYRTLAANLSRKGMFVRMPEPLPKGTKVALSLEAGGQALPFAEAEIAWCRVSDSQLPGRYTGFGVRFTSFLNPRAPELVEYLVKNLDRGRPLKVAPSRASRLRRRIAGVSAAVVAAVALIGFVAVSSGAMSADADSVTTEDLAVDDALTAPEPSEPSPDEVVAAHAPGAPPVPEAGRAAPPSPASPERAPVSAELAPTREAAPEGRAGMPAPTTAAPAASDATPASLDAAPVAGVGASAPVAAAPVAAAPVAAAPVAAAPVAAAQVAAAPVAAAQVAAAPVAAAQVAAAPVAVLPAAAPVAAAPAPSRAPAERASGAPVPGAHGRLALSSGAATALAWDARGDSVQVNLALAPGVTIARRFLLAGPPRLVVDLDGRAPRKSFSVDGKSDWLSQVRVGRHGSATRVVVDLTKAPAAMTQSGDGVELTFAR